MTDRSQNRPTYTTPWLQQVKEIQAYHEACLLTNPHHLQKQTAEKYSLSQKQIHMVLLVHSQLFREEIQKSKTLSEAYRIILKRNKANKDSFLEGLLGE